jgi:dolichol-phosphate mannosyltransferase
MISVVLPTYNEALNIEPLILEIQKFITLKDQIVVVDDNSPDNTSGIVKKLSEQFSNIKLIVRTNEHGLTSAIQRGIDESSGDVILWMDCDLSMPPSKIPALILEIEKNGFDVCVGSRYVPGGSDIRANSTKITVKIQVFLSWSLRMFTGVVLGVNFRDWSSGFIAVRTSSLKQITPLNGDYGEYFIELIYRANKKGFKIIEIPYTLIARERGYSKTATNIWGLVKRGRKYIAKVLSVRFSNCSCN